ncbi:hypothetical protein GLYMA_18G269950v4 [Glycine max]|nr:hypothetical protein GLYMA_18G269950v4 [Glycine max]KAH1156347.1 hypothetical protein GYH30_051239 [Glycine max]
MGFQVYIRLPLIFVCFMNWLPQVKRLCVEISATTKRIIYDL